MVLEDEEIVRHKVVFVIFDAIKIKTLVKLMFYKFNCVPPIV